MSDPSDPKVQPLPAHPNLEWLKKTAKQSLHRLRKDNSDVKLADAQLLVARTYGFASWRALKAHVDSLTTDQSGGDIAIDADLVSRFMRGVGEGDVEQVATDLAEDSRLVNIVGPHPFWGGHPQPLHVAIEINQRAIFDLLLVHGADVNGDNAGYEHCSPLMQTAHWDRPKMCEVLLDRGAKVGISEALLFGDDERVEMLLRDGHSALPTEFPNGGSLLALARTTYAIDRLLALDVSTTKKDRWGADPIEAMSRLGPKGQPLVRHMLSRGIKARPVEFGRLGDRSALEALIASERDAVDVDAVLFGAVDFGHHDLATWLIEQGAQVNTRRSDGATPLHSAAWGGDLLMVKLLTAAGADLTARDNEHDNTPAGWARVAVTVSNNPVCSEVAVYLDGLLESS